MIMRLPLNSLPIIPLFLFLQYTTISAQPAPAPAAAVYALPPAPPGPPNITKILEKSGDYTTLIRLLKTTQVSDRITSLLNDSYQRLTIFAPNDNAFSNLKSGTLNKLSDQDKINLVQFHILPTYLKLSNFQSLSNPIGTEAGGAYEYPLNVTTSGNSVKISTGIVNTSISGTIYTDGQLAVYQVNQVLKPFGVFDPKPLPPAPAPEKPKKKPVKGLDDDDLSPKADKEDDSSGGVISLTITRINLMVSCGVALINTAAIVLLQ